MLTPAVVMDPSILFCRFHTRFVVGECPHAGTNHRNGLFCIQTEEIYSGYIFVPHIRPDIEFKEIVEVWKFRQPPELHIPHLKGEDGELGITVIYIKLKLLGYMRGKCIRVYGNVHA